MMRPILIALLLLAACGGAEDTKTTFVNVPVTVRAQAPKQLLAPIEQEPPAFMDPAGPGASSALDKVNELKLKLYVAALKQRIAAWTAWASSGKGE